MKSYVLITGATGGLGRAFVHDAASRGWDLYLTDIPGSPLYELAQEVSRYYNVEVQFCEGDMLTRASRDQFFDKLEDSGYQFHFLINVAGIEFESSFTDLTLSDLRQIMNVNMNGTVELTYLLLKNRAPQETFRILTVSSLSCYYPMPYKAVYSASKRFLYHFFTSVREELRDQDVTITILCPAGIPTKDVVKERIAAQGFMGKLTSMAPNLVALQSINRTLEGKEVYIPGFMNRMLRRISSLISESGRARILKRRWDKTTRLKSHISGRKIIENPSHRN